MQFIEQIMHSIDSLTSEAKGAGKHNPSKAKGPAKSVETIVECSVYWVVHIILSVAQSYRVHNGKGSQSAYQPSQPHPHLQSRRIFTYSPLEAQLKQYTLYIVMVGICRIESSRNMPNSEWSYNKICIPMKNYIDFDYFYSPIILNSTLFTQPREYVVKFVVRKV